MPSVTSLPGASRQALRNAVRLHPESVKHLGSTNPSSLTKDALIELADRLGIDVPLIVAASLTGSTPAVIAPRATPTPTPTPTRIKPVEYLDDGQDAENFAKLLRDGQDEGEDEDGEPTQEEATIDVQTEALKVRRELSQGMVEGDFEAVTDRIAGLIRAANKPAEVKIITKTEYVAAPAGTAPSAIVARPATPAQPIRTDTWAKAFGLGGTHASKRINIYASGALTPAIDQRYRWPASVTPAALAAFGRGRHVWLYGPAGTGKSSFGEQLAARTGRPFFLLACDDTTEAPELVGMTVPHQGGVRWQDGVLTAAIRVPHAIVLIDEPTVARAGALMVLQSVLASGVLSIKETGEVVRVAEGVRFMVADNTNGTGGGASEGYEGTRRMNRATLDRFGSFLKLDYMAPADEEQALVAHTGCTPSLAKILVECAGLTRKARVTHALGLRRLIAWAEALTDGIDPRAAFEFTVLNSCARDDREPTEQCCALGLDKSAIKTALAGGVAGTQAPPTTTDREAAAIADFAHQATR